MATKSTTTKLTNDEIKYNRRVKSVELSIKSQGSRGALSNTIIKVSKEIYEYLNT